jgi:hypothetical protein
MRGQKQAQEQGKNTHSRNTQDILKATISNTRGTSGTKERLILVVLGGSSNKAIELVLLILGARLVIVVDSFIFLTFALAET